MGMKTLRRRLDIVEKSCFATDVELDGLLSMSPEGLETLIDARLARIRGRQPTGPEAAAEQELATLGSQWGCCKPNIRGTLDVGMLIRFAAWQRLASHTSD